MLQKISLGVVLLCCFAARVSEAETILPWNVPQASLRQVFEVRPVAPVSSLSVELPIEDDDAPLRFVDAENQADDQKRPLASFRDGRSCFVVLDREIGPERPGRIIAYRGKEVEPSPTLERKPDLVDDYASTQLGTPWDFEDGKTSIITGWGVERSHYGDVTVADGWLTIPILGDDPYFIFGVMWGDSNHPKALKIDSSVYRFLEIRLRQSVDEADWKFYLTDEKGAYRQVNFLVQGKEAQIFRFDLKDALPDFWDGRRFRALRIDPIKKRPNTVAEIDYVRLLPDPPSLVAGPMLSRKAFETRQNIRRLDVSVPETTVAGTETPMAITPRSEDGKTLPSASPVIWTTRAAETLCILSESNEHGGVKAALAEIEKAGSADWTVGLSDDLGEPMLAVRGRIDVKADKLAAYRLTAPEFVDLADRHPVRIGVVGVDRFGNELPVDVRKPRWIAENGAAIEHPDAPLQGPTVSVSVRLSDKAPARQRIRLSDENDICGTAEITTVAFRQDRIGVNENGYMIRPDGSLYYPIGGLYANWPHGKPGAKGGLGRSVDLFPCNNISYTHGFPWPEDVERKVVEYLDHCQSHGLNTLRLMLRNMDIVGRVDPVQLKAILHYFDLARERGIKFNVVLFEDYQKPPYSNQAILENIVLPHYTKEQLDALPPHRARFLVERKLLKSAEARYGDPDVLECHKDYLRELIPILAGREEVLNYEFENEMYVQPISWCRDVAAFIRTIDPKTMILANPHHVFWPKPIPWRECSADLIAYHPYNNGLRRDGRAPVDMGPVFLFEAKISAQIGLPFGTGEGGVYDGQIPYDKDALDQRVQGARDQIWMNLCAGGNAFLYWTVMHEKIIAEFGKIEPALNALEIDLKNLKRKRAAVAVAMPPYDGEAITWSHADSEANRNGKALAMRLLALGVDFDAPVQGEDADYPVRLDVLEAKPEDVDPSLSPTVARPGDGWDLATLLSDNETAAILYLRNIAGGIEDFGAEKRPCFCRIAQEAEATLKLRDARRWKKIVAFDLDSGKTLELKPDPDGVLRLGKTRSDFVIGLR